MGLGDRVFHILAGANRPTVKLSDLQINGGWASSTDGGSGILNQGAALQLDRVVIAGNSNINFIGGGISNLTGGALVVNNSTISDNSGSSGGGIYNRRGATLSISRSVISNNTATQNGGGIYNVGALIIAGSTISGNSAQTTGGGLASNWFDFYVDNIQITGSTITGNHVGSPQQGAGISSSGLLTINESVVENNDGIGLQINSGSVVSATGSQFRGNRSTSPDIGAGIDCGGQLTLQNSQISANTGAGVVVKSSASETVTISKTTIAQNSGLGLRVNSGSDVRVASSSITENAPGDPTGGAGIASAGDLILNSSTIAKNGGTGLRVSGGSAALTNTSIGANNAPLDAGPTNSVGIFNAGSLTLNNSTIADQAGGGLRVEGTAAASVGGSLFARNAEANCAVSSLGTFTSQGHNLRDDAGETGAAPCIFAGSGDGVVDVPMLDAQLADNGGYTQTYMLSLGSPAVDAIDSADAACLVVDQRGFGRPVDGNADGIKDCDIGAVESGATGFSLYAPVVVR